MRGFSSSGKTLVLMQRARYLRAAHPKWTMAVLTYNKPLQERLQAELRGQNIDVRTFHSLCFRLGDDTDETLQPDFWNKWPKMQPLEAVGLSASVTTLFYLPG